MTDSIVLTRNFALRRPCNIDVDGLDPARILREIAADGSAPVLRGTPLEDRG